MKEWDGEKEVRVQMIHRFGESKRRLRTERMVNEIKIETIDEISEEMKKNGENKKIDF